VVSNLVSLFMLCASLTVTVADRGGDVVRLYYYPFGWETYVGISPRTIEKMAHCTCNVDSRSQVVSKLRRIIEASKPSDSTRPLDIRLKISGISSDDVFIDDTGKVEKAGRRYELTTADFKDLQGLMARVTETVSCTCKGN
jgi:hypothetical protein